MNCLIFCLPIFEVQSEPPVLGVCFPVWRWSSAFVSAGFNPKRRRTSAPVHNASVTENPAEGERHGRGSTFLMQRENWLHVVSHTIFHERFFGTIPYNQHNLVSFFSDLTANVMKKILTCEFCRLKRVGANGNFASVRGNLTADIGICLFFVRTSIACFWCCSICIYNMTTKDELHL